MTSRPIGVQGRAQVDGRGEGVGSVGVGAVGVPAVVTGHAADVTPRMLGHSSDVEDRQGPVLEVRDVGVPAVGATATLVGLCPVGTVAVTWLVAVSNTWMVSASTAAT